METFDKFNDCCGSDNSNGVFGQIVRKGIKELTSIENHLSIGLAMAIAFLIVILIKWSSR